MSRGIAEVHIGDRFSKTDDPFGIVWRVVGLSVTNDGLAHARIVGGKSNSETRTIAKSVLADPRYFLPIRPKDQLFETNA